VPCVGPRCDINEANSCCSPLVRAARVPPLVRTACATPCSHAEQRVALLELTRSPTSSPLPHPKRAYQAHCPLFTHVHSDVCVCVAHTVLCPPRSAITWFDKGRT